jgi:cysteine desulfurase
MKKRIYLDYAATTPCDTRVLEVMLPYFTHKFGNASTLYSYGQEAKIALEDSREKIAKVLNADSSEIVFTSGGTESNNTALKGVAYALKDKGDHIITSQIEHHAIIEPCKFLEREGFKVTYIPVDKFGIVDPLDVRKAITKKTILVSIMHANNEIGTIQPIKEIGRITREAGVYFHTDAVQTFGHIPLDVGDLGVDLLSASAHKLYGPKGVGFLYIKKGTKITPFMQGGEQERKRRASTENVASIVGLAKAAELAAREMDKENKQLRYLRDKLLSAIFQKIDQVRLNGNPQARLPNNINISVNYIEGEAMILRLDMEGIACSTGSACSSSSLKPSHVLKAIGLSDEQAHGSLRITLGRFTKEEDIGYIIDILPKVINKLRLISPFYSKNIKHLT